jgi:hypothetical protein
MKSANSAAVLGALVADSAALGLHWLYDPACIAKIEKVDGLVFLQPDAIHYAGSKGYFAHEGKMPGDSSAYGEICLLMLTHLAKHGKFDHIQYQTEYRAYFGPGGKFVGYIDSPTRLTLRKLLPLEPGNFPAESGADDDQHPCLAPLPSLIATHTGTLEELMSRVEEVVRITNNNGVAVGAAQCAAAVLFGILQGSPVAQALADAVPLSGKTLQPLLEQALALPDFNSVAASERFGRACHVTEGLPLIFHIAQHAPDYRKAIESNIRAGGDSCGRSIMLGAIVAAHMAQQDRSAFPVPLPWLARYKKLAFAADACECLDKNARPTGKAALPE